MQRPSSAAARASAAEKTWAPTCSDPRRAPRHSVRTGLDGVHLSREPRDAGEIERQRPQRVRVRDRGERVAEARRRDARREVGAEVTAQSGRELGRYWGGERRVDRRRELLHEDRPVVDLVRDIARERHDAALARLQRARLVQIAEAGNGRVAAEVYLAL